MGPSSINSVSTSSGSGFAMSSITTSMSTGATGDVSALTGGASSAGTLGGVDTATAVQSQVDGLLSSFGSEVAGDQFLRMVIALLILNALLGKQEKDDPAASLQLAGLAAGLQSTGRSSQFALYSETSIIQIQHQSTLAYSAGAVQGASTPGAGDGGSGGGRIDVGA